MTLTLLLDLDDTLLNTNMDSFIPAYFQALARELTPQIAPEKMFRALISGTGLMNESDDFSRTLEEVFNADFYPQINVPHEEMESAIENFYDNVFPTLAGLTSKKADAKPFVDWALAQGIRIAIATDPLLPRKATHHRLRWAGFEPEGPVLMVGNDMERDILPAQKLGLATYYIDDESASRSGPEAGGRGNLQDLRLWLESTDLASLTPSFKSIESLLGILSATPAVLNGLSYDLAPLAWTHEPTPDDWSFAELICHMRDTEREIHQMQIRLFMEQDEPFIPRPDTSIWASQRDYLHEDGMTALREFNDARRETLALLKNIEKSEWTRKARHAIFGPTNFFEVISFIADHDRMHIQQAWSTLKKM